MSDIITHQISKLEFGSLLSYSPIVNSEAERKAKDVTLCLKGDCPVSNPPAPISEVISRQIKAYITKLPFAEFFTTARSILVPVPKSSLMREPEDLWVPRRIANALVRNGLGEAVAECLQRIQALPKSATSPPANRPSPVQHYNSLRILPIVHDPKEILLIDDVITRGATMLGAANRLRGAFPDARIRAFAAMRTMSPPLYFNRLFSPQRGEIIFDGQYIQRRP